MASDAELNYLAREEHDYCPLSADGIAIAQTLDAITRGDSVPTVDENGRAPSTEVKSHFATAREIGRKVWPWALAAGILSVRLYSSERQKNISGPTGQHVTE